MVYKHKIFAPQPGEYSLPTCVPTEDSVQLVLPSSLIRIFAGCSLDIQDFFRQIAKTLMKALRMCWLI